MINFLKLIRYKNLLMVLLTLLLTKYVLIHHFLEQPFLSDFLFSLFAISILCITASGYIINDIFDIKSDLINKPDKVIIGQKITIKNSYKLYLTLNLISLFTSFYVSFIKVELLFFLIFPITIITLYLYSKYLKKIAFIGNFVVAIICSSIIYLLYYFDLQEQEKVSGLLNGIKSIANDINLFVIVFYYSIFSFLTTLIREIIKDIEDIDGDYAVNMKTLPIIFGKSRTKSIVLIITFLTLLFEILIIRDFFVYEESLYLSSYLLLFCFFPLVFFIYKLWYSNTKQQFKNLSNYMKIIMLLGILSMTFIKFQ